MNEGPWLTFPIWPKWPGSITGHVAYDEHCTIIKEITDANVNAWIDVLLVHEYPRNDVLHNVVGHHGMRAPQPLKSQSAWQRLAALRLSQSNNVVERCRYETGEVFAIHGHRN